MSTTIFSCAYCGADITELVRRSRHYSSGKTPQKSYCDKAHRAAEDMRTGHFAAMSRAGKAARSQAVTASN